MKKVYIVITLLLGVCKGHAQFFKENFYYEGELAGVASLFLTDSKGEAHVFTYGGLNFRGGLGIHDEDGNLFLGLHSGIDGNFRHHTGILPVYLNSRIALDITEKGKLVFAFGYGKSFQMGPEKLKGFLRKYTLGYAKVTSKENLETFFIECNNYGFVFPDNGIPAITLNLGYTFTFL